jgi:hypothetical protein
MGRASLDKIIFTREIAKHSDRSQHSEDGFPRSPPGSHLIWLSCLFQESYNVQYEMTRKKALMLLLSQSKEQEQEEQEVRPHISTLNHSTDVSRFTDTHSPVSIVCLAGNRGKRI